MRSTRRRFLQDAATATIICTCGAKVAAVAQEQSTPESALSPLVKSVRSLGSQFLNNDLGITGADGATSTVLPSGNSLWMFGDTVEGPFKSIRGLELTSLRSNTGAIVPRQDASSGVNKFTFLADPAGKRPRQVVPFLPNEDPAVTRIWAIHGVSHGKSVYLFYHRISLLKGVDVFLNFKLEGMGIAKSENVELQFKRLTAPDGSSDFWKGDAPTFGVFVIREAAFIYLWGSLATGMYLARTRPGSIEDVGSYEYLVEAPTVKDPNTSPRWEKAFNGQCVLFDSVPNEMSVSYNAHLKKYVAFHSFHRENKIVLRTAERLTGPWSEPQVVYRPTVSNTDELIYAAKEHPELARDGGRVVYVTYVSSASYIPQLIEVTLS